MKHFVILALLVLGIVLLANRTSDVDKLMIPVTGYSASQVGNRFIEMNPADLPTTPDRLAEPGVITVVYFHDDTCPGCLQLDGNLDDFLRVRPDVAVRKIRISSDTFEKTSKDYQWNIYATPCILLYGKNGKLIAADRGSKGAGQDLLEDWIGKELEKATNTKTL